MRSSVCTVACLLGTLVVQRVSPVFALPPARDFQRVQRLDISQWWNAGGVKVVALAPSQLFGGTMSDIDASEGRLDMGASDALKTLRRGLRRVVRFLGWSASRWAEWLLRAAVFLALTIAAPLLDRELVLTWNEKGWRGVRHSVLLGTAVHVRLLLDRRSPLIGKLAVVVALSYGVVSSDLLPDKSFPIGALDDVLAVVLASRGFMLLCPQSLVETHAARAASAHDRLREWQRSGALPPTG